jgi:LysR family transcriptional activator of nhaA
VFEYAEEIFALGRELTQFLNGRAMGRGARLTVGIADALPKLVVTRLLEPALRLAEPVVLHCYEDKSDRLLAELTVHSVDLVLSMYRRRPIPVRASSITTWVNARWRSLPRLNWLGG